jgi:ubiquinone/menaquinone biosynthesis C-methylase UbiE
MSCPICGGKTFDLVATEIREGEGRIVSCAGCGLVMQDLAMGPAEIARYYNEEYQRTNSLVADIVQSAEEHFQERIDTVQALFEMIRPRLQPLDDVLEIGCGAGELLFCIKPLVRSCIGAEMNKAFVEYMRSTLSMEAYAGDFLQMGFDRTFDLIVMIDTLDACPIRSTSYAVSGRC